MTTVKRREIAGNGPKSAIAGIETGRKQDVIYFVVAKKVRLIKIGYTAAWPDRRFLVLQVNCPVKLTRLALMKGERPEELEVHERFAKLRSHGEWFRDTPALRAFVAERAKPWSKGDPFEEFESDAAHEERRRWMDAVGQWGIGGGPVRPRKSRAPRKSRPKRVRKVVRPDPFPMLPEADRGNSFDLGRLRKA